VIRFLFLVAIAVLLVWCGSTVKLGEYTCLGHARRIWNSEETKDLKEGVKEKATSESTKQMLEDVKEKTGPVMDRVKRGVEAGISAAADTQPAEADEGEGEREVEGESDLKRAATGAATSAARKAARDAARKAARDAADKAVAGDGARTGSTPAPAASP
jgi:hypothetical protein